MLMRRQVRLGNPHSPRGKTARGNMGKRRRLHLTSARFRVAKPLPHKRLFPKALASTLLGKENPAKKNAISQLKMEGNTQALIFIAVFCEDSPSRNYAYAALDGSWEAAMEAASLASQRRGHARRHAEAGDSKRSTGPLRGYYLPREEFICRLIDLIRKPSPNQNRFFPTRQAPGRLR
jgi:hypothetical protein